MLFEDPTPLRLNNAHMQVSTALSMLDERAAEFEILAAIYGNSFVASNDYSGYIEVAVAVCRPVKLLSNAGQGNSLEVSYLSPVRVCFELPKDYPGETAPMVKLKALWLPERVVSALEPKVTSLWEEYGRMQVMYAYVSQLEEASESAFGVERLDLDSDVLHQLLDYDRDAKRRAFEQATYECGVCLDPKKGLSCHEMEDCKHVFCVDCLQGYYNNAILAGNINNVKCPSFDCGEGRTRRATLVTPRELLRIPIERPAVQRYVDLKRKNKLESDKTTVWCPRQWCQGAVKGNNYPRPDGRLDDMGVVFENDVNTTQSKMQEIENQEQDETVKESRLLASRLQICEDCSYAFCRLCSHSWHGDFFDCRARTDKPHVRTIAEIEEEASLDFIRQNTSKCPKCDTPVQKSEACNHMTCTQCRSHFCYLCSAYLNPEHPYAHFNRPGSFCHQRLWEGQFGGDVER